MIALCYLAAAILLIAAAACSSGSAPATAGSAPAAAAQPQPARARTAEQIVTDLAAAVSAAKPSVVYTAETDPNKLLGRPNGYTSKASFTDSRIKAGDVRDTSSESVDQGGSVEVYADEAGAAPGRSSSTTP